MARSVALSFPPIFLACARALSLNLSLLLSLLLSLSRAPELLLSLSSTYLHLRICIFAYYPNMHMKGKSLAPTPLGEKETERLEYDAIGVGAKLLPFICIYA
jgi:hypothetical protein